MEEEFGGPAESVKDVPLLFKTRSFQASPAGSGVGLDKGMDVVDGKLVEVETEKHLDHPLHSALHTQHQQDQEEPEHQHHHVHIGREVKLVEIPSNVNDGKLGEPIEVELMDPPDDGTTTAEVTQAAGITNSGIRPSYVRRVSDALKGETDLDLFNTTFVFDEEFERKRDKQQRKVEITKGELKTLHQVFVNDSQKQDFFLESVLASQHMKQLITRYGSKQKNVKQFFLESVDEDTKLAVFGSSQVQEVKASLLKAQMTAKIVEAAVSGMSLDDEAESKQTFPTVSSGNGLMTAVEDDEEPLVGTWSKRNFWESLERLEERQRSNHENLCREGKDNPLVEIYGPMRKPKKKTASVVAAEQKEVSEVKTMLEPFPDKYLEPGVQDVIQSEAVRRLWAIVKGQLELFNVKDPLAHEMFGTLYDEVRSFARLPEEDVADFNNGNWEPPPLDEKRILAMEPFEKLRTRFGIYQKAFSFLAQHFETLTPMFADIKQAYEDVFEKGEKETLEVEREQMEELELRYTLTKHVRYSNRAGHRLLMQVKAEAHALQEHIQWQHHTLHTILGILWKMRLSLKTTNYNVGQLKNLYKARIETLAKEIVSAQGQTMFEMALPGKYTEIMQRIRNQADPKEIRRMLLAVRRQLRAAHRKIVMYEADYADTVPKSEFEVPQKKYSIISKKNQTLLDACNVLKTERQFRKQAIAALKSEIYETSGLVTDLKRKPTPRPSWTKISSDWPAGQSKFSQMRDGQSTRTVLNRVVEELTGKKVGELIHYIPALGKGDKVPVYLRYDQPLLNRNFTANEANFFIKDLWKRRVDICRLYRKIKQARKDEEEGNANYPDDLQYDLPIVLTFPEYVAEYFRRRCHLEQIRMEWTYNLMEACRVFASDVKLAQFKGILEEKIDESIYHLFHMELDRLRDVFYAKANESHDHRGYLEWTDVLKYVGELCPNKTEEQIATINNLGTSFGVRGTWAVVRAQSLFEAEDDTKESEFVELLYQQFEDERKEYVRDIYMEILTELGISEKLLEHDDDPVWQTDVSMPMFFFGVTSTDPTIPDSKLISYLAWVYLGVTALPGVATLGTRLVDFLRERAHLTEADLEKYNEDEDIEFENCIREIKEYEEDEATMDKLDLKKRRLTTKKLRFASLRQVIDRLYSGPIVRYGQRIIKFKAVAEPVESEVVVEVEPPKRHRHKHKHRHHRRSKKEKEVVNENEFDDFGFDDFSNY